MISVLATIFVRIKYMDNNNFKNHIAEVKNAYSIVDYIEQSGISLKGFGNKYKGLCPFHQEKTPSFTVDDATQFYHCFGCGESGDLITFVEKTENLSFIEAVKKLAEEKNIVIDFDKDNDSSVDYQSLRACIRDAANFFYIRFKKLSDDHPAKQEVLSRGLSLQGMKYGYAPEGRQTLYNFLKSKGFSDDTILQTGVCVKSEKYGNIFDFWQGRLMFFITDISGKVIGFSGRRLYESDTRGKYVNSSATPLFDKSVSLFNIFDAKKKAHCDKTLYVTEGQFDVAAFIKAGLTNVVASSGTAFTNNQGLICRRLVSEDGKIIFSFDGDSAGKEAALKVFKNIPLIQSQSYVVIFPDGQDPCDYQLKHGDEELVKFINHHTVPLIEFVLQQSAEKYDLMNNLEKTQYIEESAKILKTITSVPLRQIYIKKIALETFTDVETIKTTIDRIEEKNIAPETKKENADDFSNSENNISSPDIFLDEISKEDQDNLLYKVKNSNFYSACSRLMVLSLKKNDLLPALMKNKKMFPKDFSWFFNDLSKIVVFDNDGSISLKDRIVPELFSYSYFMKMIFEENYFSLEHVMTDQDFKELFSYLCRYVSQQLHDKKKDSVRSKIYHILDDRDNSIDVLEKALSKDKELLSSMLVDE